MSKLSMFLITFVSLLFFSSQKAAAEFIAEETPEKTVERFQQKINTMQSLSFNFYQQTRGEMTGRPRKGSGKAIFYKKNSLSRMRWDYSSPDKQVLVSDGIVFSMYFENLQQMIVTPAENLDEDITYSFFTGKGNLKKNFLILPPDKETGVNTEEFQIIKLVPRQVHSQIQDVHIWITPSSLIRRMNIRDQFGTITLLNLSDIQVDSLVDSDEKTLQAIFSFIPPDGTEIIEQ